MTINGHHLTTVNPEHEVRQRQTYAGMATWAATGPTGMTCRECRHWSGCGRESGRYASAGLMGAPLKPRPCAKFATLMNGKIGPAVPHSADACRFLEPNPDPPAIFGK
jgi:hypothetical protein